MEPSTTPVAAGPTSEPSSAAPPAWQTVTFLSSRASKRLPPVLVGPTTTILDALDATATLPRTLINAWRRGEELTRPVFWIEKKGDKVMLPESLPVSVVAAGAGEIEIQFAAKAADRGDLHEFSI